jgi:hypothetical protein
MISLDTKEVKDLADDLRKLNERGLAFASRETLNNTVFKARQQAQAIIERKMIQRNTWTKRSIKVEKVKTLALRSQEAAVGSIEGYMEQQEFGGTDRARGKRGLPITTSYAAGQRKAVPRTKALGIKNPRRLSNIRLSSRARKAAKRMSRKQRVVMQVQMAVQTGKRFIYLDSLRSGRKGIYEVEGGKKGRPKRGWPDGAYIYMVHDLSHRSVRIPATPWLRPAVNLASLRVDDFYRRALLFQLRRLKTAR